MTGRLLNIIVFFPQIMMHVFALLRAGGGRVSSSCSWRWTRDSGLLQPLTLPTARLTCSCLLEMLPQEFFCRPGLCCLRNGVGTGQLVDADYSDCSWPWLILDFLLSRPFFELGKNTTSGGGITDRCHACLEEGLGYHHYTVNSPRRLLRRREWGPDFSRGRRCEHTFLCASANAHVEGSSRYSGPHRFP